MEYRKPTTRVLAKAISAIEGSDDAAKGTLYLDGEPNPNGSGHNDVAPAYEVDE